jgi:hypothetical protein
MHLCSKKGEKQRFSNYGDFKKSNTAANGPPLDFWVQNTLVHGRTACLTFPGQKRNFWKKLRFFNRFFEPAAQDCIFLGKIFFSICYFLLYAIELE